MFASAIDQIIVITQQATYKQSSHDVKKSGLAPFPLGIPAQTRANVVIESNTAPHASRVDGIGQVDVGDSNVNLPSVGGSSKVIKGRFSFVNDISVAVDYKLTTAFSNFVEANMQLGEEMYLPGDQKLDPCFDFKVEQIDDKTFFHT
uniref:Uncharacterized protein n=1 Tax=Nicotiana tabacum TaxID=4097 RepID=A0A1S4B6V0_TOBAC|nr:PREDICTED: uncharacterized protein LOC107805195 [Nicotiana tabacum]